MKFAFKPEARKKE